MKELKLFNGRAYCCVKSGDARWARRRAFTAHAYIAAYSVADACRVVGEYTGRDASWREINEYWNKNAWGIHMAKVTPERGLWVVFALGEKPVRLV